MGKMIEVKIRKNGEWITIGELYASTPVLEILLRETGYEIVYLSKEKEEKPNAE